MNSIFLFPLSYPYYKAGENTFLQNEIQHLLRYFDKIIIFPKEAVGERQQLPDTIEVDVSFSKYLEKQYRFNLLYMMMSIINVDFWSELKIKKKISRKFITRIAANIALAILTAKWFESYIKNNKINNQEILIYSYWTTGITLGLGYVNKKYNNIKLITRAHGIDLYEERGYVFCRNKTLELVDRFYVISQNGLEYLKIKFPQFTNKIYISRLGVKQGEKNHNLANKDNFVIVSCSNIIGIKRVELILDGLIELVRRKIKIKVIWYHFGEGELKNNIKSKIDQMSINNRHLECFLMGAVPNQEILDFYRSNFVGLFINTSSTEGIPVSMMEAQSFGIPILATSVGGVQEIVTPEVGFLLPNDPSPEQIADGIYFFLTNAEKVEQMRLSSLKNWDLKFNADKNFEHFSREIRNLF